MQTIAIFPFAYQLIADGARANDAVVLEGNVIEAFFFGAIYRHLVNVNDNTILVDRSSRIERKRVRLAIPCAKIQVFAEGE